MNSSALKYAERITLIDAGKPLIAKGALLGAMPFRELAAEGVKNIDACIDFLGSNGHSQQERMIAILSMHQLDASDYASFLEKLLNLYQKKLVSKEELGLAVVPSFEFSTVLIENYHRQDIQAVLKEIMAQPDIRPATRKAIEGILTGKALDDMRRYTRECCAPRN